jgi:type III secretory pathway component EscS
MVMRQVSLFCRSRQVKIKLELCVIPIVAPVIVASVAGVVLRLVDA